MGFVPQLDESDAEVPKVLLVEHGKVARWSQRDLQQWTAGGLEGLANLVMFTKSEHIPGVTENGYARRIFTKFTLSMKKWRHVKRAFYEGPKIVFTLSMSNN